MTIDDIIHNAYGTVTHTAKNDGEKNNDSLIAQFCKRYAVTIVGLDQTYENGYDEPMYYFSDNLGGYTLEGIQNSLADNE